MRRGGGGETHVWRQSCVPPGSSTPHPHYHAIALKKYSAIAVRYFAIYEEILCNIQKNTGEYFDKYHAISKEISFQMLRNTVKYEKKYCAIFEEILLNTYDLW